MNNITLRLASPRDASELAKLRLALRSRPGINIETDESFLKRCEAWMCDALNRSTWRCWVAVEEPGQPTSITINDEVRDSDLVELRDSTWSSQNRLAGALWLQLIEKIPNPTAEPEFLAYITNFFVTESARGMGLGSRMLNEALNWCSEQNVHTVILWPTDRSRSLYLRHGFTVPDDLFELTISPQRGS